jgi:Bardet-Biedl syndrome 1 protein
MTTNNSNTTKWMNAMSDALAGLNTLATCMALADLAGDGDYKLIVADLGTTKYNMKLRVYKGVVVMAENALVDLPAALTTFFIDNVSHMYHSALFI